VVVSTNGISINSNNNNSSVTKEYLSVINISNDNYNSGVTPQKGYHIQGYHECSPNSHICQMTRHENSCEVDGKQLSVSTERQQHLHQRELNAERS